VGGGALVHFIGLDLHAEALHTEVNDPVVLIHGLEKPDPVGEFIGQLRRDLYRQAGLADPANLGQRDQPTRAQRSL
jgi:hypothetical protein